MSSIDKEDNINKPLLLQWLLAYDRELPMEDLARWIEGSSAGKYAIVKKTAPPSTE